jgi:hypothetical protein
VAELRSAQGGVLYAWRWLFVFFLASLLVDRFVPDRLPMSGAQDLLDDPGAWRGTLELRPVGDGDLSLVAESPRHSAAPGREEEAPFASLAIDPPEDADFLRLDACLVVERALPTGDARVMLASVNDGTLDFNRHYGVDPFYPGGPTCSTSDLSRWRGDGSAVVQVQFVGPGVEKAVVSALSVTPVAENPAWRVLRRCFLSVGIALLGLRFAAYLDTASLRGRGLIGTAGLGLVAGIIFGCCVSVPLKADIFALLTGGRSLDVSVDARLLLAEPFPVGDFLVFTSLHAVLFAAATLTLAALRRHAWIDLVLLGVLTETLQRFVPGRGPGISDMIVDWYGIAIGLGLLFLFRRSQRVRLFLQE